MAVISHVLNEQGTEYEYSKLINLKNGIQKLENLPKFESLV